LLTGTLSPVIVLWSTLLLPPYYQPIHRQAIAGLDQHDVAQKQLFDRHFFLDPIAAPHQSGLRAQLAQRLDRFCACAPSQRFPTPRST
jgi:hypothetical protein